MKRLLLVVVALTLLVSVQASGQARFGITGGLGWSQFKVSEIMDEKAPAGWNAGVTVAVDLPLGFSIQPTLRYHHKSALIAESLGQRMGYLELPVSLQWGPDLLVFRPFLDFTPYIGYALSNEVFLRTSLPIEGSLSLSGSDSWDGKQRFEYGLGLGGGIEVWRLQIVARYNWNFGKLYDVEGWDDIKESLGDLNAESSNFGGVTLGLAFFF